MSNKPRKKKGGSNNIKMIKAGKVHAKDLGVVRVGTGHSHLIDIKTMDSHKSFSKFKTDVITQMRHKWSIYVAVCGVERNLKRKVAGEQLNMGSANYYSELTDEVINLQNELIEFYANKITIRSVVIFAVPSYKYEFQDETKLVELFEKFGAFDKER